MLQKLNSDLGKLEDVDYFSENAESLRIDVFTSEYCSFCDNALEVARTAAGRATYLASPVKVIETSVDDRPELIEAYNLVALPLIQVGRSQIIGLPSEDDIERLIHQTLLMG
ncbi:MAG: hypothetical protein RTU63_12050 [Candidatus Thorarchaeota archaeon]